MFIAIKFSTYNEFLILSATHRSQTGTIITFHSCLYLFIYFPDDFWRVVLILIKQSMLEMFQVINTWISTPRCKACHSTSGHNASPHKTLLPLQLFWPWSLGSYASWEWSAKAWQTLTVYSSASSKVLSSVTRRKQWSPKFDYRLMQDMHGNTIRKCVWRRAQTVKFAAILSAEW